MMKSIRQGVQVASVIGLVMLLHACDGPTPTESVPTEPRMAQTVAPSLVYCPADETAENGSLISLLGGTVHAAGHRLEAGLGSLASATLLSIRVPPADHMRVELSANGLEHFEFLRPVRVTIDYSRCPLSEIERGPLSVWYVDDYGRLLENMGGVDDRATRSITFWTDHFSGYAIAN